MRCRMCRSPELRLVISFGSTPLANALRIAPDAKEQTYPLEVMVCAQCQLVQLGLAVDKEILFGEYTYATPDSPTLRAHYGDVYRTLEALGCLRPETLVVEMGSNTGAFLKTMPVVKTVVGVEPAIDIALKANESGVETYSDFFCPRTAKILRNEWGRAGLIVARHCFAHIDDLDDVMQGVRDLITPNGVFYFENAYVVDTMEGVQFDQIYHEHMSYLGVIAVQQYLTQWGMDLIHVERKPVHGGSMLFYATPAGSRPRSMSSVRDALVREHALFEGGMVDRFVRRTERCIVEIRAMVESLTRNDRVVDLYGATAKSATLLHACGISDKIRYAVDGSPLKHGKYLPGSQIKILPKDEWRKDPGDYALLGAWNFETEILVEEARYRELGGKFIVPVPEPRVV